MNIAESEGNMLRKLNDIQTIQKSRIALSKSFVFQEHIQEALALSAAMTSGTRIHVRNNFKELTRDTLIQIVLPTRRSRFTYQQIHNLC